MFCTKCLKMQNRISRIINNSYVFQDSNSQHLYRKIYAKNHLKYSIAHMKSRGSSLPTRGSDLDIGQGRYQATVLNDLPTDSLSES